MNVLGAVQRVMCHRARWGALLALAFALASCSKPEPIKIGFVAGLSGRVADLGAGSLNGAMLAVEKRNASGGINGRPIELVVRNDAQDAETARRVVKELIDQNVVAIVGHLTSSMSMATLSLANEHKMLMISPTTTTTKLSGKDDQFFRVINSTRTYASKSAHFFRHVLKKSSMAIAYDRDNLSYSQSWMNDYRSSFEFDGGKILVSVPFDSGPKVHFKSLAQKLLASKPDAIMLIASAVDAALICQQIRAIDANIVIGTSEWASTEQMIELGGKAVEGIYQAQFIDRFSKQPEYLAFRSMYLRRFGKEPGSAGVTAYDATNVILEALPRMRHDVILKDAILSIGTFEGLQEPIVFDAYGDAPRRHFITRIKDGQFRVIGS